MQTYIRRQHHKNFKHQGIEQKEPPQKGTSRQRSGKSAIRKKIPTPKTEVGKNQTSNQVLIP